MTSLTEVVNEALADELSEVIAKGMRERQDIYLTALDADWEGVSALWINMGATPEAFDEAKAEQLEEDGVPLRRAHFVLGDIQLELGTREMEMAGFPATLSRKSPDDEKYYEMTMRLMADGEWHVIDEYDEIVLTVDEVEDASAYGIDGIKALIRSCREMNKTMNWSEQMNVLESGRKVIDAMGDELVVVSLAVPSGAMLTAINIVDPESEIEQVWRSRLAEHDDPDNKIAVLPFELAERDLEEELSRITEEFVDIGVPFYMYTDNESMDNLVCSIDGEDGDLEINLTTSSDNPMETHDAYEWAAQVKNMHAIAAVRSRKLH